MMKKKSITTGEPEPNHEEIAAELERLLSSDLSSEQWEILTDELLELSNDSGVTMYTPGVVSAFYLTASTRRAELQHRADLREIMQAIQKGEKFKGYQSADGLQIYRLRLKALELMRDRKVNKAIRRELKEAIEEDRVLHFRGLIEQAEASKEKGGAF